ncbi:COMM domain-containing protein 4 isoform X2 [Lontra canadensis]|uniref:COMM domain-containing protein 4 isoform X2 n=1 Tax=Lontra canadensis TaxID=76717 RepID=UPI0013F34512|nr:COMM domain-containing protein 4 isoform X2 [Lontra canadensis]
MRFRFCGDLDCPDWVLAEISTLAKISSVKLRLLCSQVLKELLGQGIDYEKILKLTADARFESGDVKATVAVLSFILSSAAKHSVDGESLSSELQQLGLPKEHAASLCRCYEEKQSPLQEHLRTCSLRGETQLSLEGEGALPDPTRLPPTCSPLPSAELKQAQTLMSSLG